MINVLGRFEFDEFLNKLSILEDNPNANHLVAICNYTSRRFDDINHGLRNGCNDPKHIYAVKLLMEALDTLPIYRKVEFVIRWILLTPDIEEIYTTKGSVFNTLGFTSTSYDPDFSFKNNPEHHKLIIQHQNGRAIDRWSEYPEECEVLIPYNSFFQVMHYDEEQKTIFLQQITQDDVKKIGSALSQRAES